MEITKYNFTRELDNITKNLEKACYIGFDAEFASLLTGDRYKYRLFQNGEDRYNILKNNVSKMMMTQIGLTVFHYDHEHDIYRATAYTFHLRPQALGDINQSFIFKASSLNFLCKHNFDYNKFLYEGLPFLSRAEEAKVRQSLKDKTMLQKFTKSLELSDEKLIQEYGTQVSKWLHYQEDDTFCLDVEDHVLRILVHIAIRKQFPTLLTTNTLDTRIIIYRNKDVKGAIHESMAELEDDLVDDLLGFSRIMYLLERLQKPIIGHNMFMDIVFLHNQFIGPLPSKYSVFKKNIHNMLPNLYDTKYISNDMYKMFDYREGWKSNTLQDLYEFFAEGQCRRLEYDANFVILTQEFGEYQTYHEAGWDSFCTGYCFLRLAQWMAWRISGIYRRVGPTESIAAVRRYLNKVNIIRGAIPYMSLVEADPPSHRPNIMLIEVLNQRRINIEHVIYTLEGCGAVDVKPYGRRTALLASGSNTAADKVKNRLNRSNEYRLTAYNAPKPPLITRMAMWTGAILTGTMIYMIHMKVKVLLSKI